MKAYTVGELALVSQRDCQTLCNYHDIGLLNPANVGANGYRSYSEYLLLRLQQVLVHLELSILLGDIAAILDALSFNQLTLLRR